MNNSAGKSPVRSLAVDLDLLPGNDKAGTSLAPLHCHIERENAASPENGEIFTFSFSLLTDGFSVRARVRFQDQEF
jgi:hypothetical protein